MLEDEVRRHKTKVMALWMFFFAILFAVLRDVYLVYDCQSSDGEWDPKKRTCTLKEIKATEDKAPAAE